MKVGLQTWGSQGDVEPFLALAGALAEAGHQVRLVVTTQSDKELNVPDGVALKRVGVGMTGDEGGALMDRVIAKNSPMDQGKLVLNEGLLPSAPMMFEAARELAAECDIIVRHHFLYMTRTAAQLAGKPEISVFLTPDLLPTKTRPPTGMPSFGPLQSFAWWMANKGISGIFGPPAAALCAEVGLPKPAGVLKDVWPSATANLVAVSPALCERPADWPGSTFQTGFWQGPATRVELPDEVEAFLNDGEPPVYATFGSMTSAGSVRAEDDVQLLTAASKAAGQRLILQTPLDVPSDDDVLVVSGAPHARVFPQCAAVIHHGGAGTTQTAVRAGAPSVVVPHLADQFFWADQVVRLGVGVKTPARSGLQQSALSTAIARACSEGSLRTRASEVSAALETETGVRDAVQVVESFG